LPAARDAAAATSPLVLVPMSPTRRTVTRCLDGRWESSDCHWSPLRKAVASAGDVVTLHGILFKHPDVCDAGKPVY
jgi:hypothetical protein